MIGETLNFGHSDKYRLTFGPKFSADCQKISIADLLVITIHLFPFLKCGLRGVYNCSQNLIKYRKMSVQCCYRTFGFQPFARRYKLRLLCTLGFNKTHPTYCRTLCFHFREYGVGTKIIGIIGRQKFLSLLLGVCCLEVLTTSVVSNKSKL